VKIFHRGYEMRVPRENWPNFMRNLFEARISFGYMAPGTWERVYWAAREFENLVRDTDPPLRPGYWPGRAHFGIATPAGEAWEHVSVFFMDGAYVDWPDKVYEEAKYIPALVDGFGPVIVTPTWT